MTSASPDAGVAFPDCRAGDRRPGPATSRTMASARPKRRPFPAIHGRLSRPVRFHLSEVCLIVVITLSGPRLAWSPAGFPVLGPPGAISVPAGPGAICRPSQAQRPLMTCPVAHTRERRARWHINRGAIGPTCFPGHRRVCCCRQYRQISTSAQSSELFAPACMARTSWLAPVPKPDVTSRSASPSNRSIPASMSRPGASTRPSV
jgi:hypothetical protein